MPKRIILLSDGTGNSASKVWKSNVWRVFESLDLRGNDQVAFYDDGVGTSSFKPLAVLGGVFGYGLKRNVLDIYKFLCANYTPNDQIFGFGFSRGAFTMRVVMGLVLNQGLVRGNTDAEFYQNAKMAYRAYRAERFHTVLRLEVVFRFIRDAVLYIFGVRYDKKNNQPVDRIEFLGLWDTVAAYGLPIDEMAIGVSRWIWPLELPDRSFNPIIQRACHALSLDDERTTFHPVLWNEQNVSPDKLTQVWFSGVHSNVGGGYPDDSLAYIPLYWIMNEARGRGLAFKTAPNKPNDPDPDMVVHAEWRRDKDGRLYDSRNGLGGYYRYGPRKIEDLSHMRFSRRKDDLVENNPPTIHETAITRARAGAHRYAPIGIPQTYQVLTDAGLQPQGAYETPAAAKARCAAQEDIWNQVWRRRIVYFITVFATIYIVLYPLAVAVDSSGEYSTRLSLVSGAIRAIGQVLPGVFSLWIDAYARDPSHFIVLGSLVAVLILLGVKLGRTIEDKMERVWRQADPANVSKSQAVITALVIVLAIAAIFHDRLPASWLGQQFLKDHISLSMKIILASTLVALFTPAFLVYHLRTWGGYRAAVRGLKLYLLPFFLAVGLAALGLLFGSHLIFSVEESFGRVCQESSAIASASDKENQGLSACPVATVASCGPQDAVPFCSNGRVVSCGEGTPVCETRIKPNCDPAHGKCDFKVPVCHVNGSRLGAAPNVQVSGVAFCPSSCEVRPNAIDMAVHHIDNQLEIGSICKATGIWLEQGQPYRILVAAPGPKDANAWKVGHMEVSTRGLETNKLSLSERLWQIFKWPLKRHLFVEPYKVIARVGSTGTDERVLEASDNPKSNSLDLTFAPKRSGELFLYVNDAVWFPGRYWRHFYRDNVGKATIEVRRAE
jgi:type VI secretion system (T6SS) phospholipase Tle1-like effector